MEPFELTLNQVNFEEKDLSPTQRLYSFRSSTAIPINVIMGCAPFRLSLYLLNPSHDEGQGTGAALA